MPLVQGWLVHTAWHVRVRCALWWDYEKVSQVLLALVSELLIRVVLIGY